MKINIPIGGQIRRKGKRIKAAQMIDQVENLQGKEPGKKETIKIFADKGRKSQRKKSFRPNQITCQCNKKRHMKGIDEIAGKRAANGTAEKMAGDHKKDQQPLQKINIRVPF